MEPSKGLWKLDLAIWAAAGLALFSHHEYRSTNEPIDAEVIASVEREVSQRKTDLSPKDRLALTSPLDCDAIVAHSKDGKPRCYVRPELTNTQGKHD